ncbi:hypothetical protein TRAPUB_12680 [Trametes pubescens]|uniref:Uncharacterized protein n=1 Tax=Trametes pubescens TaxID=154538 RepID=A0A1M2VT67_TRAPU|nr:hypothetical protein TRAPUB_12680 [Trametes pubescens]
MLFRLVCRTGDEEHSLELVSKDVRDVEAKAFGFRNASEFQSALQDFVAAHEWAFKSYAKALIALGGGPECIDSPPKQLQVKLRCLCARGSSLDPARTFAFQGAQWQTAEEYTSTPAGALDWQKSAALREAAHRANSHNPRYTGILPVIFAVENSSSWQGSLYPQYRTRASPFQFEWATEGVRDTLLADVLVLCASSIHLGLALRCAEGQDSFSALPGRFFCSPNKRWKWEPLLIDWDQYLAGPRGIQEVDSWLGTATQSGMPIQPLLQIARLL